MPTKIRKDDGTYVDADDVAVQGAAVADAAALTATALTGTLTGTANGSLVDVAASAAATAGGATPSAAQVDTGIATAVATIVSGVNEQNKEMMTKINAIIVDLAALRTAHQNLLGELETSGALTPN